MNKKKEIQQQIDFIFKDFEFNKKAKSIIENANKLLHIYEKNKDIMFYDIEDSLRKKIIKIIIKFENDSDLIFTITDEKNG